MRISRDCFANFVADFRMTFVRVSHECRENFHVSQTSHELVVKVLKMFKKIYGNFSPKYFARLSPDCRATVANLSLQNFGEFTMQNFRDTRTNVVRVLYELYNGRATVLRKHAYTLQNFGEFTMQNFRDTRTNVVRVLYDGRTTVLRKHANTSRLSGEKIKLSGCHTN